MNCLRSSFFLFTNHFAVYCISKLAIKTLSFSIFCRLCSSPAKAVIRRDNRQFENINERCRPSVIAMKYDTLESQEWVDAKESLEDTTNRDEEEIVKFLCFMLMVSIFFCNNNAICSFFFF